MIKGLSVFLVVAVAVPMFAMACRKGREPTPAACDALLESARVDTSKSLPAGSCETNADCTEVSPPSCLTGCGGYPVSTSGLRAAEAAVKKVSATQCAQWDDSGCPTISPRPMPSCARYATRCRDHQCTSRILSRGKADCESLDGTMRAALDAAFAKADKKCTKDSDCTTSPSLSCHPGCGAPAIAATGLPSYRASLRAAVEACEDYRESTCWDIAPMPMPSCPMFLPKCNKSGTCE